MEKYGVDLCCWVADRSTGDLRRQRVRRGEGAAEGKIQATTTTMITDLVKQIGEGPG